ncbi:hypothetical protein B6D60_03870 [candidate division KSB1 bacterium 4484_87]|nr:MAG: hypothetical protein B6D60_03870 [candidate division KSB1 bacterium 4484_87]
MIGTMDSPFKRAIFIAIVIAVNVILLFTAFLYRPEYHQQAMVILLIVIQAFIFITYFAYRKMTASRVYQIKKLKNPRLQENTFEFSSIMQKEFDYIREAARQAMDDRHSMINFFLLITGAVVSFVGARVLDMDLTELTGIKGSFLVGLAIFLNIIGWIYFMHMIRLRQAWWSSAEAMNQIKEFYIVNGRVPDDIARSAFLWRKQSIPDPGKKSNVFYYSMMLISFIASAVFFFASWLVGYMHGIAQVTVFSAALGVYHFLFQISCYSLFLDYKAIR